MITETLTEIIAEATAALEGLEATVTEQPHDAVGAVVAGVPAVLVLAGPEIEYTTVRRRTATWTVWVITPTTSPDEAAGMFEPILEQLAGPLGIDRARPETYDIGDRTFPGYTLTFTTEHN